MSLADGQPLAADQLHRQFPDWSVSTMQARYGIRIEACREDVPGGLYAVIGTYAEVAAELENVSSSLRAS